MSRSKIESKHKSRFDDEDNEEDREIDSRKKQEQILRKLRKEKHQE